MDATDNNDKDIAGTEAVETKQRAGQLLQAARQSRGLSIEDVARHLRLSVRQITALEEDDYAKLSGGTFLRGFMRNYARLMQLDATPLLQLLQESLPPVPRQVAARRTEGIPFPSDQKSVGRSLIIAGVVVMVLLFLIYEIHQGNETVPQPAVQVATKAEAENELAVAQAQSELSPTTFSDADPVPPAQEIAPIQQRNSNPLPQQQVVTAVAAPDLVNRGEGVLRFAFAQESWVEINDGTGRMIFSQLNPAGSEQVIRGRMPFYVVIGNAANVKLVYNNKPVDLAPHTNSNGGVARLSLE